MASMAVSKVGNPLGNDNLDGRNILNGDLPFDGIHNSRCPAANSLSSNFEDITVVEKGCMKR